MASNKITVNTLLQGMTFVNSLFPAVTRKHHAVWPSYV